MSNLLSEKEIYLHHQKLVYYKHLCCLKKLAENVLLLLIKKNVY